MIHPLTLLFLTAVLTCHLTAMTDAQASALDRGRQALEDGVPHAALHPLQIYLDQIAPGDETFVEAVELLTSALVQTNRHEQALTLLEDHPGLSSPTLRLNRARALAAMGRHEEALELFRDLTEKSETVLSEARQGLIDTLILLEEWEEALEHVKRTPEESREHPWFTLRKAWIHRQTGDLEAAHQTLATLPPEFNADQLILITEIENHLARQRSEDAAAIALNLLEEEIGVDPSLRLMVLQLLAQAALDMDQPELALPPLHQGLADHPDHPELPSLFPALETLSLKVETPNLEPLMQVAALDIEPARTQSLTLLIRLNLENGNWSEAIDFFHRLQEQNPDCPGLPALHLDAAEALIHSGQAPEALQLIEQVSDHAPDDLDFEARKHFLLGKIFYQKGAFQQAAEHFESASEHPANAKEAAFNHALALLHHGDLEVFSETAEHFENTFPGSALPGDLRLEEALLLARQSSPDAPERLELFLERFDNHARAPEARLALAELDHLAGRRQAFQQRIEELAEADLPPPMTERVHFLQLFADNETETEEFAQAAENFLRRHPESPLADHARMELAESYFSRGVYSHARNHFEILSLRSSDPAAAEIAAFLAGRASMMMMSPESLDESIGLFERAARADGPLRAHARFHQALAKKNLGKPEEAVVLFRNLLESEPPPEIRYPAAIGLASTILAGEPGEERRQRALDLLKEMSDDEEAGLIWRNQAGFKLAKSLEQIGEKDAATAIYYDVVRRSIASEEQTEHFWSYKAGFDLIRLLETQEQLEAAARICEQLAAAGGQRAEEAREHLTRLRLEHFLWE